MRTYPEGTRQKVHSLRKQGMTYREIREKIRLDIPKGTMSYWVRNIKMTPEYYKHVKLLASDNIWKAQAFNKQQLKKRLDSLRSKNIHLVKDINMAVGKLLLATLYWCEGSKYPSTTALKFGNADPRMINLFITLLRQCYKLDESKFRLTLQCRSDQQQLSLSKFWSKKTKIPLSQHYQPRIDKRSIGKPTKKLGYKGVCVIEYFDVNLQCELQFFGEYLGTDSAILQMKNQIR